MYVTESAYTYEWWGFAQIFRRLEQESETGRAALRKRPTGCLNIYDGANLFAKHFRHFGDKFYDAICRKFCASSETEPGPSRVLVKSVLCILCTFTLIGPSVCQIVREDLLPECALCSGILSRPTTATFSRGSVCGVCIAWRLKWLLLRCRFAHKGAAGTYWNSDAHKTTHYGRPVSKRCLQLHALLFCTSLRASVSSLHCEQERGTVADEIIWCRQEALWKQQSRPNFSTCPDLVISACVGSNFCISCKSCVFEYTYIILGWKK